MVKFSTPFHMSNDSRHFRTSLELVSIGAALDSNGHFQESDGVVWLPLYEAKMIHQFDHRFATFEEIQDADKTRDVTPAEHADPEFVVMPRYWVPEHQVEVATHAFGKTQPSWFLGFRDITNSTNERTAIFTILPWSGVGNSLPLLVSESIQGTFACCLLASLCSFVFDFAARQKVGGTHMNFFIVKQLPVLPPGTYTPALLDLIVPRVLELVYTAHDLTPFARDCGYDGPPFVWDEARRAQLRADLDGIYAHLYGLSRDDFAYILDTFPIVKRNDEKAHGEFRTKRLCLAAWDEFRGVRDR